MGLVEERQYGELFARYVQQVSHWVKHEKIRNSVTGRMEDPDEDLMVEVERTLGAGQPKGGPEEVRRDVITRIGAWSIDHPNQKPDYSQVFPRQFQLLRDSYFDQQKKLVRKTAQNLLVFLAEGSAAMQSVDRESRERVETTLNNLKDRYGYCEKCAREAVSYLLRRRYA